LTWQHFIWKLHIFCPLFSRDSLESLILHIIIFCFIKFMNRLVARHLCGDAIILRVLCEVTMYHFPKETTPLCFLVAFITRYVVYNKGKVQCNVFYAKILMRCVLSEIEMLNYVILMQMFCHVFLVKSFCCYSAMCSQRKYYVMCS
jgi:hypothetical protein